MSDEGVVLQRRPESEVVGIKAGANEGRRSLSNSTATHLEQYLSASKPIHSKSLPHLTMSLTRFFQEPFFTLDEFDQLFDDAFNARQQGNGNGRVQRRANRENALRPR